MLEEPSTDDEILVGTLALANESLKSNWATAELVKLLEMLTRARQVWLKVTGEDDNHVFVFDSGAICLLDPKTNQKHICVSHGANPVSGAEIPKSMPTKKDGPVGTVDISFERLIGLFASFYPPKFPPSETFVCRPRSAIQQKYLEILEEVLSQAKGDGVTVTRLEAMQSLLKLRPEAAVAFYEIPDGECSSLDLED